MPSGLVEDVGPDRRGARVCAQHVCLHSDSGLGLHHPCPSCVWAGGGQTGVCKPMLGGWQGRTGQGVCVRTGEGMQGQHSAFLAAARGVAPVDERGWASLGTWVTGQKVTQVGTGMK